MKTNSLVLRFMSLFADILWYLGILSAFTILSSMIFDLINSHDHKFNFLVKCKYKGYHVFEGVTVDSVMVKVIVLSSPLNVTVKFLWIFTFIALCLGILYYKRRIFRSIKSQQPFHTTVINSLRVIGILIASLTAVSALRDFIYHQLAVDQIPNFNSKLEIVKQSSYYWFILGAVFYIIADIFKYGHELKKETEEFV